MAEEEKVNKRIDAKLKAVGGAVKRVPLGDARRIVREEISKLSGTPFPNSDVEEREFFKNMNRIANSQRFPLDVRTIVENYTKAKIFNLGIRVQCSVCDQRSWHPLEAVRPEIQCPICLSQFRLPTHDPRNEIKWRFIEPRPVRATKAGVSARIPSS